MKQIQSRVKQADLRSVKALSPGLEGRTVRGYTNTKRRLRILRRDPLCVLCLATPTAIVSPSTEVDHIKPVSLGGSESDANLQGLCHACHAEKTTREAAERHNGTAEHVAERPRALERDTGPVFA